MEQHEQVLLELHLRIRAVAKVKVGKFHFVGMVLPESKLK